MATKTFYVTRDMKHPLYKTRMLRAGDQLELDGPTARLYTALKAISPEAPARARVAAAPVAPVAPPPAPPTDPVAERKPTTARAARKPAKRKAASKRG